MLLSRNLLISIFFKEMLHIFSKGQTIPIQTLPKEAEKDRLTHFSSDIFSTQRLATRVGQGIIPAIPKFTGSRDRIFYLWKRDKWDFQYLFTNWLFLRDYKTSFSFWKRAFYKYVQYVRFEDVKMTKIK